MGQSINDIFIPYGKLNIDQKINAKGTHKNYYTTYYPNSPYFCMREVAIYNLLLDSTEFESAKRFDNLKTEPPRYTVD